MKRPMFLDVSRRRFLRGAGGVTVGLPWLESLAPRCARAGEAQPVRIVFFFFSNGVNRLEWLPPAGTPESGFALPGILQTLAPLRKKLVITKGIHNAAALAAGGNAHATGMNTILTATKPVDVSGEKGWGGGQSIDAFLANKIGQTAKFASLQLGVQSFKAHRADPWTYSSYDGPHRPVPNEDDPSKVFDRLFSGAALTPPGAAGSIDLTNEKRRSLLDFVADDYDRVRAQLGAEDRIKVQAHLDGIRQIEKRLSFVSSPGAACKAPLRPTPAALNDEKNFPVIGKLQMDLLAIALACNLTKVASLQWSAGQSPTVHSWLQAPATHHHMSHRWRDEPTLGMLRRVQVWYMEQLLYFASKLDSIPEGNGTVLDNTVIVTCSEIAGSDAKSDHLKVDMPFLLLGGCGGKIKGDRFLDFSNGGGRAQNDLYVSLANHLGAITSTFGDPALCKGPLPGLS